MQRASRCKKKTLLRKKCSSCSTVSRTSDGGR